MSLTVMLIVAAIAVAVFLNDRLNEAVEHGWNPFL